MRAARPRPRRRPRRVTAVAAAVVAAVVAVACGPGAPVANPTPSIDDRAIQLDSLRRAVVRVSDLQDAADDALLTVLDATRAIDTTTVRLLDVTTLEDAVDGWSSLAPAVEAADPSAVRSLLVDLAVAADQARMDLATARTRLDQTWEVRYLDAQDVVLMRVRDYAEVTDRLAQLLERHWDVYTWYGTEIASFVERRWFFRTTSEARDAFAVETDTHDEALAAAQGELARYRREREQAGAAVNDASAAAAQVWESRPSDQPTLGPGATAEPSGAP